MEQPEQQDFFYGQANDDCRTQLLVQHYEDSLSRVDLKLRHRRLSVDFSETSGGPPTWCE
ncbi:hypothetical protein AB4K20DRAFT_1899203 [Rhizopus microsporus]